MIAFRSSPFSFPATNCILIVLIAPCRRCDDINYSTTWKLFSFLFSPSFPLFSQPLAKDTLPNDVKTRSYTLLVNRMLLGYEYTSRNRCESGLTFSMGYADELLS